MIYRRSLGEFIRKKIMLLPEKYSLTKQWKYIFTFEKRAVDNYLAFQTLSILSLGRLFLGCIKPLSGPNEWCCNWRSDTGFSSSLCWIPQVPPVPSSFPQTADRCWPGKKHPGQFAVCTTPSDLRIFGIINNWLLAAYPDLRNSCI